MSYKFALLHFTAFFLLAVFAATDGMAAIRTLGTFGNTYPIAEKNAIEEMKKKAAQTDWSKHLDKEKQAKAVKNFRPQNLRSLPRVTDPETFLVDMTYSLEFDIIDQRGVLIYPKGFTFNPLDYMDYPRTLVFIDGSDKDQVQWLKSSEYVGTAMILVTDGVFWDVRKELNRHVYYATNQIIDRLGVKAVPSIAYQSGRYMEIKEVDVEAKIETNNPDSDTDRAPLFAD
jgi:conjugal transfer pilus assembly protein TraW